MTVKTAADLKPADWKNYQPFTSTKAHIVVDLLKELSFIEFREIGKANKIGKASAFRELYGIWKGREVTLDDLRQKAWQRKTS